MFSGSGSGSCQKFRVRPYPDPQHCLWWLQPWHLEVLSLILLSVDTCWKFAVNSLRLHYTNSSVFICGFSSVTSHVLFVTLSIFTEESKFADFSLSLNINSVWNLSSWCQTIFASKFRLINKLLIFLNLSSFFGFFRSPRCYSFDFNSCIKTLL